ncbi:AAA family ATPase [Desulfosediminicola flagellatus]|uniref:AAA family ATPase n=1 Tax=Desulfosediminicola flagellatus TaxID=2569541 RepID=UPI0010AD85B0|nr:AAA family ATPase [Desulfosediminicola flagellatus]
MNSNELTGTTDDDPSPFVETAGNVQFYPVKAHVNLLARVNQDIADLVSVILLTGDSGSGKSAICRKLIADGFTDRKTLHFENSIQSFEDVVRRVADIVDVEVHDLSRRGITEAMSRIVSSVAEQGIQVVLVCDMADKIYLATLERIRKMLDAMNDSTVHFQVVFIGEESLLENINQLKICDFDEVPESRYIQKPLSLSETTTYLEHCCKQLPTSKANIFTPAIVDKIFQASGGNLNSINSLSQKILTAGNVEAEKLLSVPSQTVQNRSRKVVEKIVPLPLTHRNFSWRVVGGIGGGIAVGVLVLILMSGNEQKPELDATLQQQVTEQQLEGSKQQIPIVKADSPVVTQSANTNVVDRDIENEASHVADTTTPNQDSIPETEVNDPGQKIAPIKEEVNQKIENVVVAQSLQLEEDPGGKMGEQPLEKREKSNNPTGTAIDSPTGGGIESGKVVAVKPPEKVTETKVTAPTTKEVAKPITVSSPVEKVTRVEEPVEITTIKPSKVKVVTAVGNDEAVQEEEIEKTNIVISSLTSTDEAHVPLLRGDEDKKKIVGDVALKVTELDQNKDVRVIPEKTKEYVADTTADVPVLQEISPPVKSQEDTSGQESQMTTKRIPQVNEAIVPAPEIVANSALYNSRRAAGASWLSGKKNSKYTMQLMVLSSDNAEGKMNEILSREGYAKAAGEFYIFKKDSTPPAVFVFYGEYDTMTAARDARNTVPGLLRKHKPYVLSVAGAMRKVK